ncbi:thermonuclease family protein [Tropicibacter naphthalenivorans]|uniref:Succinoglycan biosynthesis protein ExoI n=1 Tax=Tropicibacter naphthalenivorans TaxID=441103 RepID=A0A0P1G3C7_9RHOB|nr:thermonuclease family protein [Tropicibacter naphthalenivorans]CUH76199.1 Succinoglycan biosynthesis protein ExoI [Tropicibacter naphthalenivorans]SMC39430.1 Endonuclease YncB, thermonuclease family [Tropicibacter naphthalenivorans]
MLRLALIFSLALSSAASAERAVTGPAYIVDGDTLVIDDVRIRLHGIDAVEKNQMCGGQGAPMWPCGKWVTAEVKARYGGRDLSCFERDVDRYGRMVAVCYDGERDLNRELVRGGLAFAYPKYSMNYVGDERHARNVKAGLFGTGVATPATFRKAARDGLRAQKAASVPEDCQIKGNISLRSGEKIYHVPGQEYYLDTVISPEKGERYFCSERDAIDSGWRRAKK